MIEGYYLMIPEGNMKTKCKFVLCAGIALAVSMVANGLAQETRWCGIQPAPQYSPSLNEVGGLHITASGTLRVLIVFASFPDDETPHPYWPAHNPPLYMQQFIDPDTMTTSQHPFNLTNYFRQMSLGQFHLVGEAIWVETGHYQSEYLNGSYGRANWSVIQERVDPLVDFSRYDNWTNQADRMNINIPDSLVDMIIMVWRTNVFESVGEASLGYKTGFLVDGKRIEMGFPERYDFPRGSGVTCEYLYSDDPSKVMRTMVHEFGHWLLGGPHPYNSATLSGKHQYWGILCAGQRISSCANAYERERLGWIAVPAIQPDVDTPLPDYLSTGTAYKYHPLNGDPFEYFYVENHQGLSAFDDVTLNPDDKGAWILHQQGPYMEIDNVRIRPSDGNWNWRNPGDTAACFSQKLPVFVRGVPSVVAGESHRDQIPTNTSTVNWMFTYKDPAGQIQCGAFFAGQMFSGAFTDSNPLFSPYSNPNSNTWNNQPTSFSLEVVNDVNGVLTVRYPSVPLDASPARRYLGIDPTVQNGPTSGIPLAWGTQWTEGQPLEEDVNWSELQRQIGNGGIWSTVYEGSTMRWIDESLSYDSSGAVPVLFRVRIRDTQAKYSPWSNVFYARAAAVTGVEYQTGIGHDVPASFMLGANHPNPFNPATKIIYSVPWASWVTLKTFDILGREIKTLVDEIRPAGSYTVTFDGASLTSGTYLYRLSAGTFLKTRAMILLK